MKKRLLFVGILLISLICGLCFFGCNKTETPPAEIKLTLSSPVCELERFGQKTMTATVENAAGEVEWSVEDDTVASIYPQGESVVITGLKEGETSIVASVGDKTASAAVYVNANKGYPILEITTEEITVREGSSYTLEANLKYQEVLLQGVTIAYEIEQSSETVSVQGNVLNAIAPGTATLTAFANYCGERITAQAPISVTVAEDVAFVLDVVEKTLYTSDPSGDGEYDTQYTLKATGMRKGEEVELSELSWTSENEEVATVENGTMVAVGKGQTTVTAGWTYNGKLYEASCLINVVVPRIQSDAKAVDIDLSLQSDVSLQVVYGSLYTEINANQAYDEKGNELIGTFSDSTFTFDPAQLKLGEQEVVFSNGLVELSVPVVVATMIVSDKEEFLKIKSEYFTGLDQDPPTPAENRDGYFILDADIDFGGDVFAMYGLGGDTLGRIDVHGWFGTIDGRGHIVSRMEFGKNGLTDVMGWTAVIKNIGFVDCSFSETVGSGIFGEFSYGKIDNCFFQLNNLKGNGAFSKTMNGVSFTNSVVYISDFEPVSGVSHNAIADTIGNYSVIDNLFAVTTANVPFASSIGTVSGNYGKFSSFEELRNSVGSLSSFNDEYWTKTDGTLIFTRYNEYLQNQLTGLTNELSDWYFPEEDVALDLSDVTISVSGDGLQYLDRALLDSGIISVKNLPAGERQEAVLTVTSLLNPSLSFTKNIALLNVATETVAPFDLDLSETGDMYTFTIAGDAIGVIWNGKKLDIDESDITSSGFALSKTFLGNNLGENEIIVLTNEKRYACTVTVASLIVSNWEEFLAIQSNTYYKGDYENATIAGSKTVKASQYRDGYFILDADIDCGGKQWSIMNLENVGYGVARYFHIGSDKWDDTNYLGVETYGWSGVLDGRGYTIYNFTTGYSGMFGHLSSCGVIKNVGLICNDIVGKRSGVIGNYINGTIDNVYIELKACSDTNEHALIGSVLLKGTITNTLVVYSGDSTASFKGVIAYATDSNAAFKFENVYAIFNGTAAVFGTGNASKVSGTYGVYASIADLLAANESFDGYNTGYWAITQDGIAWKGINRIFTDKFNSYVDTIPLTITQGVDEIELDRTNYSFIISSQDGIDADKWANGIISVSLGSGEKRTATLTVTSLADPTLTRQITLMLRNVAKIELAAQDVDSSLYNDSDVLYSYTINLRNDNEAVENVTLADSALSSEQFSVAGNVLSITLSQSYLREHLGERELKVVTDCAVYTVKLTVASLIVSNWEEFLAIQSNDYYKGNYENTTVSGSTTVNASQYRDGYFILDADIDCGGKQWSIMNLEGVGYGVARYFHIESNTWNDTNWKGIETYGWSGVLDGRGYTIYNFTTGYSGMFGHLSSCGVIKNVGLICNDIVGKRSGVIGNYINGTIDNVYIELKACSDTNEHALIGSVLLKGTITNTLVVYSGDSTASFKGVIAYATDSNAAFKFENVYAIFNGTAAVFGTGNASKVSGTYGVYASIADLLAANESFDGYNTGYWAITQDGIAWKGINRIFTDKFNSYVDTIPLTITQGVDEIELDRTNYSFIISSQDGIDADKWANGIISVSLGSGEKRTATLTVTSLADPTLTRQITLMLRNVAKIELAAQDVDSSLYNDSDVLYSYTINLRNDNEAVENVTLADSALSSEQFSVAGNVLSITLSQSYLREHLGERELKVVTDCAVYTVKLTVASLIVSNWEEFLAIQSNDYYKGNYANTTVAGSKTVNASQYRDGYFILDADIDCDGKQWSIMNLEGVGYGVTRYFHIESGKWQDGNWKGIETYGWSGVLDGRGHTISNFTTGRSGMFGHLSSYGVIKNVGLICTNKVADQGGVIGYCINGKIDNVYIELLNVKTGTNNSVIGTWLLKGTISNTVAVVKGGNAYLAGLFGKQTDSNANFTFNNVYVVNASGATIADYPSSGFDTAKLKADSCYGSFESLSDLVTAVNTQTGLFGNAENASFDGYNTDYWTITEEGISFKTAQTTVTE